MYRCATIVKTIGTIIILVIVITNVLGPALYQGNITTSRQLLTQSPKKRNYSKPTVHRDYKDTALSGPQKDEDGLRISKNASRPIRFDPGSQPGATGLQVVYTSLEHCKKPSYLPEYNALCYNDNISPIRNKASLDHIFCLPNHSLLGIRKCGTTDVIKWFQYHSKKLKVHVKGHNIPPSTNCPLHYFGGEAVVRYPKDADLMYYSPGDIMFSTVKHRNSTHLTIQTTLQFLAFLSHPEKSRYILTLRNPTDRLISYLFHAHNMGWTYTKISKEEFSGQFVHDIVVRLILKLDKCLKDNGELACVYMYSSKDGNLDAVLQHGLYVVYVQELFNFISRGSVYINQLEEYSENQLEHAEKFMAFFGRTLNVSDEEIASSKKQRNTGKKSNVLPETLKLLNDLYRPYNERLAALLEDEKWLYKS